MTEPLSELEQDMYDPMLPIARHEFGHYAVARHVGFKTYGVNIAREAPFQGAGGQAEIGVMRPLRSADEVRAYCEARVKVLSAGVLAEALEDGVINNQNAILYVQASGSGDYAKSREHLRILHNLDHPYTTDEVQAERELKEIYDRLWGEASTIVLKYAEFIEQMADELTKKEVISFEKPEFTEAELAAHPLVLKNFP